MPTAVMTSTWSNATNAQFREWGKAISDGIAAVGLTKVTATGTVDWATAATVSAANAVGGWEIWAFNDALAATHPLLVKIEYGATSAGMPGIWVTLAKTASADGTLGSILAPRRAAAPNGGFSFTPSEGANIEPIYISSDGSSLCVAVRSATTGTTSVGMHAPAFVIDRSRDSAGAPTAAGGVILTEGSGDASALSSAGNAPASMHAWTYSGDYTMGDVPAVSPMYVNSSGIIGPTTSLANGDKAPVFPFIVCVPNHAPWQVLAAVAVMAGDAANGPFTANVLGAVRDYRSILVGRAHSRWMASSNGAGQTGLCILWED